MDSTEASMDFLKYVFWVMPWLTVIWVLNGHSIPNEYLWNKDYCLIHITKELRIRVCYITKDIQIMFPKNAILIFGEMGNFHPQPLREQGFSRTVKRLKWEAPPSHWLCSFHYWWCWLGNKTTQTKNSILQTFKVVQWIKIQ